MTRSTSQPGPSAPVGDRPIPVSLGVPARHDQLPVIRLLTEMVAMHAGCTLDQVADVKLAVDQVCTLLMDASAPGTELTCRYRAVPGTFEVTVAATTTESWAPQPNSLEGRILASLTEFLTLTERPDGDSAARHSTVVLGVGTPG